MRRFAGAIAPLCCETTGPGAVTAVVPAVPTCALKAARRAPAPTCGTAAAQSVARFCRSFARVNVVARALALASSQEGVGDARAFAFAFVGERAAGERAGRRRAALAIVSDVASRRAAVSLDPRGPPSLPRGRALCDARAYCLCEERKSQIGAHFEEPGSLFLSLSLSLSQRHKAEERLFRE